MSKTTIEDINLAIKRINKLIPQKTFSYYKTGNHYYVATRIDGRRHISAKTKIDLYNQLWTFIEGLEVLEYYGIKPNDSLTAVKDVLRPRPNLQAFTRSVPGG